LAPRAHISADGGRMGTPADYTILVVLLGVAVGVWTLYDRLNNLQREVETLKRKLGAVEPPDATGGA
jgi:hypothetical protein